MRHRFVGLWHGLRERRVLGQALALTGALVIAFILVVGPWYLRSRQQATPPADGSATREDGQQRLAEEDDAVARFESLQMVIPEGWARVPDHEKAEGGVLLYLRGPLVDGQHLVVAVQVYRVPKDTTLSGFTESYMSGWGVESFPFERDIRLCDQPARVIGFTNDDGDNLVVFCLHRQQVYAIAMVAPADTMAQHLELFHGVLAGLQLFE